MKKFLCIILAMMLALTLFVGCGNGGDAPAPDPEPAAEAEETVEADDPEPEPAPEGEGLTIGINNFGLANFFARIGQETMIREIEAHGHTVISTVTADVVERTAAIESMVAQGVDAIIIQEGCVNEVEMALREAQEQGVIVASLGGGYAEWLDIFVASNESEIGRASAEKLVYYMGGEGRIIEIYHDGAAFIRERRQALHDVVANYPDISIEWGFIYAWPDFFPDVKSKTEAVILANPEPGYISGVFAVFDGAGIAAASAFREAGLTDYVFITGVDGDPEAYREMRLPDSPFVATVAQDPETMAVWIVQGVIDLLQGRSVERIQEVPGIVITRDNIPEDE
jgi:ribose transport system substrate-binding protein